MTGPHHVNRRDFLRTGAIAAGAAGLALNAAPAATPGRRDVRCIFLFLTGGPSQLDTWDPKPSAPADVRGPFRPTRTSVPGVHICEHFPRTARLADRYAVVRSVHHGEAAVHETGQQLLQTGHLTTESQDYPHLGSALSCLRGRAGDAPPFVILPGPMGNTGITIGHGQEPGFVGSAHAPVYVDPARLPLGGEPAAVRDRYGRNPFGGMCLAARRLIQSGTRFVAVNMFDTVFSKVTWDAHAVAPGLPATLGDYETTLCPVFDLAYSALLEDLADRGMLETTLVVAAGEFGRTPKVNPRGGRDHWPGVWSVLFAGGGVRGGQVIGSSDRTASEPRDRPVHAAQVAASVYYALGVDRHALLPSADGRLVPLNQAEPVAELF